MNCDMTELNAHQLSLTLKYAPACFEPPNMLSDVKKGNNSYTYFYQSLLVRPSIVLSRCNSQCAIYDTQVYVKIYL